MRVRKTDFHHEAFFYAGLDGFLAGTVPFLREGLEAGEPALVAVARTQAKALGEELGGDGEEIRFVDMEELGRNPARIIPAWHRFVDERCAPGHPVRGIGEPLWPGRSGGEIDECQRHESLLNYAFWDGPAWRLLCPYDSVVLDEPILEAAHGSHAFVSGDGGTYRDAAGEESLDPDSVTPFSGLLPAKPYGAIVQAFDRAALHDVRALAGAEAARRGFSHDRTFDLVAAVGELTANSVMHGGGQGLLSLWAEDDALVVEVEDEGTIREPLTGRRRPKPDQDGGRGLWMVNHLCDLVQVRSGPQGTAVRVRMEPIFA